MLNPPFAARHAAGATLRAGLSSRWRAMAPGARLASTPRPVRFAATGSAAAATQLGLLALLTRHGWSALPANATAFLVATQLNFTLSSLFTWRDRFRLSAIPRRWFAFHGSITSTALLNMLVFTAMRGALPALAASALGIVVASLGNFFLHDRVVFRKRPASSAIDLDDPEGKGDAMTRKDLVMSTPIADQVVARQTARAVSVGASVHPPATARASAGSHRLVPEANGSRHSATVRPETAPVYSIVAPIYNEEETLPHFYRRVVAVMEKLDEPFELILVNDGSRDRSLPIMTTLRYQDDRVKVIDFSRNFGHQIAISAGLDHAQGQAVVVIDSDLQDPPEVIPQLIARWKEGAEVVYAQRAKRAGETRFKLLTASLFYRLIRTLTSVDIPSDTGDFRLLDRRAVDILVQLREHHRFMRGLSAWVGFRQEAVQYDRQERFAGTTKYPLRKMIRFSLDAITSFSHVPLQLATSLGFLLAGGSLAGILLATMLRLVNHAIVGQASTLILVLFMGGIQLIFLGIIGEYLGRIYDEVRARPLYVVRDIS